MHDFITRRLLLSYDLFLKYPFFQSWDPTVLKGSSNPRRSHMRWFTGEHVWTRGRFTTKVVTCLGARKPQAKSQMRKALHNVCPPQAEKKKSETGILLLRHEFAGRRPTHHNEFSFQHWSGASRELIYTKSSDEPAYFSRRKSLWRKLHASGWASLLLGVLVLSVPESISFRQICLAISRSAHASGSCELVSHSHIYF